jgi:hypothetical protein
LSIAAKQRAVGGKAGDDVRRDARDVADSRAALGSICETHAAFRSAAAAVKKLL